MYFPRLTILHLLFYGGNVLLKFRPSLYRSLCQHSKKNYLSKEVQLFAFQLFDRPSFKENSLDGWWKVLDELVVSNETCNSGHDSAKGLRVFVWVHPRRKWIGCNLQKSSRQWLYFQSLMDSFSFFLNRENFEQAALSIQIWVGLQHNIKIQKCYFLGLVALSPEIQY